MRAWENNPLEPYATTIDGVKLYLNANKYYTVVLRNSQAGELGGFLDIIKQIGTIGAGAAPAIVPLIPGISTGVGNAISAGSQILSGWLSSLNQSGQAKGLAAINAFGQAVIQQLEQLKQQAPGMEPAQVQQIGAQIAGMLSNSQYVYQAKNGNDAAALRQFKETAAALVQQANQVAGTNRPSGTTPGTTTPGTTTPGGSTVAGISTNYLIIGGAILAGIWILKS